MNVTENPRTLFLLRHAKSSWSDPDLSDFDRPLNKRGLKARNVMASYLQQNGYLPELIICSSAKRAKMTLEAVRPVVGAACEIVIDKGLYLADAKVLAHRVERIDPVVGSIMLIGHNPGLQMLALSLAAPANTDAYDKMQTKFPTAALCVLRCHQNNWAPMQPESYELLDFTVPRSLVDA